MLETAHSRWLVAAWAVVAAVGWSGDALIGWEQAGWVPAVVAVLVWRRLWWPSGKRLTREATGTALRRHEDPGPELRQATEEHAPETLARSPWQAWGLAVVLILLAAGCVAVGWHRGDGWDAAPAPVLLAVAVGAVVVDLVSRQRARRWLDDPPVAVERVDARP